MTRHVWDRSCSALLLLSLVLAPALSPIGSSARSAHRRALAASSAAPRASASPHPSATPTHARATHPARPAHPAGKVAFAAQPGIDVFRGLGAWIDLYDLKLDARREVSNMKYAGVRTLYIQTGRTNTKYAVEPRVGAWLVAAHEQGIRVVGWYLPYYKKQKFDVQRTVAIAHWAARGHRFDGIGVDIEVRNGRSWNLRVAAQMAAVRKRLARPYPLAAITPPPLQMEVAPRTWAGFPWQRLARSADAFLLMSYWSDRSGCPAIKVHCAYEYTAGNVQLTRVLAQSKDVLVHIIGGIGNQISDGQLVDFVRAVQQSHADGSSIYDVSTTTRYQWRRLRALGVTRAR
jgi:hypothetical protein